MTDGWKVGFTEDEIMLEYFRDGQVAVIISVEQDDIEYALLKNGRFIPGAYDASTDLPAVIEEITDLVGSPPRPGAQIDR